MKKCTARLTACLITASLLTASFAGYAFGEEYDFGYDDDYEYETDSIYVMTAFTGFNREGDALLEIETQELRDMGFDVGDEVKVEIPDLKYSETMPLFVTDSDSKKGETALINEGDNVAISVAMGNFSEKLKGAAVGSDVMIYLHERDTYLRQYELRNPERTNSRGDYSSNAQYANFRAVTAGTISADVLYRSSSPINDTLNRADYAAAKMEKAGVRCVINLSDNEKKAKGYMSKSANLYYKDLYDEGNVLCLGLGYDFESAEFKKGICEAVRFMQAHEGPYLIHCTEGKDRTGFLCALLESFMGASVAEMTADYMNTYRNFYHYDKDSDEFSYTKKNYLKVIFFDIAGTDKNAELLRTDYHRAAVEYLKSGGITDGELKKLEERLKDPCPPYTEIPSVSIDKVLASPDAVIDKKGGLELGLQEESIAVYNGKRIKPGRRTMIVDGTYMYNGRDYRISYSKNKHAGEMKAVIVFKNKTDMNLKGAKKVNVSYTIEPKTVSAADIHVKLNKKGTKIRFIKDLDLEDSIAPKNYDYDMDNRIITFKGDYSGTVSF